MPALELRRQFLLILGAGMLLLMLLLPAGAIAANGVQPIRGAGARWTVCIDPGHPSEVGRGTAGRRITEIEAAWEVARKLQAILQDQGIRTVMTKDRAEQFVSNRQRAEIANGETTRGPRADLLVRLHCDADSGSGFATYYPDRQGRSGRKVGPTTAVLASSREAAAAFHQALGRALLGVLADRGLHPDTATAVGRRQGALTGSIYSRVPVLLLEMCVLTNRGDDAFIASTAGQWRMARAIADGVRAALERENP